MLKRTLLAILISLAPAVALAQGTGQFTAGHALRATGNGAQYSDGGGAAGSTKAGSGYLTELGITNTGIPLCINDSLTNAVGGYHRLCFGANVNGAGGMIDYEAIGGATPLPLTFRINGADFPNPIGAATALSFPVLLYHGPLVFGDLSSSADDSANLLAFSGHGNSKTTAIHVNPGSGTLPTGTITELSLQRTGSQAFGGNYGRWSISNLGSDQANQSGIIGEFGGTTPIGPFLLQVGIENPPNVFASFEGFRFQTTDSGSEIGPQGAMLFGATATVPRNQITLPIQNIGSPGTRDSHAVLWEGKANDGPEHTVWWRQKVNVTSNSGASTFKLQRNLNGVGWTDALTLSDADALSTTSVAMATGGALTFPSQTTMVRGNQTPVAGSAMKIDNLAQTSTFPLQNEAGIWPTAQTYAYFGLSKEFTGSTVSSPGPGAPLATLFAMADLNGTTGAVTPIVADCNVHTTNGYCTGMNIIARSNGGGINAKLVGLEIDVEPAAGDISLSTGGGIFVNAFSTANGPVMLTGGISGGTFANGILLSGIASTGTGLGMNSGSGTINSLVNTTNGTYGGNAIILANTHKVQFTGASGTPGLIYMDGSNFMRLVPGAGASAFLFRNNGDSTNLATLDDAGNFAAAGGLYAGLRLVVSPTAPTIASGGCTSGSTQSITQSNGSAAFEITLGGATCGSTITLTMPAAPHNWVCDAHNITTPASNVLDMTGAASTTAVVLTNYVRTTGVAGNFTGAEKLAVKCLPY